ncbi:SRPBCC family protein [Paractinoplanes ferrugineus]|uniref:Activator of HSP90 ATPase n=1 Tax=Paractinoplanes ferrugineus TaxID=113564 RepID=A0A919J4W7_9ACTN|nr:SRPBCC domain-containing protein [Actinoplanes ferrugineus]GIE14891.1 activator of HSP90 ATPase [Actinoplanes ferrugineus]
MTDEEMTFRELDIVRVFEAPRELLWRAWTDPNQICKWWGPAGMHTPRSSVEIDLRPGGTFRVTMVADADGTEYPSDMRFTRLEEPSLLEFEWDGQRGLGAGKSTITFVDLGDGRTEMTNHYAGYLTDMIQSFMVVGSNQQFDKLGKFLTPGSGRPDR